MTKKEKKNLLIVGGVVGAGILIWYLWDKQIGPFAPGGALATASSPPVSTVPTASSTTAAPGSTTTNVSTVNTGSTSATPNSQVTTLPYVPGKVYVPFTAAAIMGNGRQISNTV